MKNDTDQQLVASASLVSSTAEYVDVDAYVKLPDGTEFLQRMYVQSSQPEALIRDDPRFSQSETSDFDDGGVVQCPPEVMAAFDASVQGAKSLIQKSLQIADSAPAIHSKG
jgi:hypothetical protein